MDYCEQRVVTINLVLFKRPLYDEQRAGGGGRRLRRRR